MTNTDSLTKTRDQFNNNCNKKLIQAKNSKTVGTRAQTKTMVPGRWSDNSQPIHLAIFQERRRYIVSAANAGKTNRTNFATFGCEFDSVGYETLHSVCSKPKRTVPSRSVVNKILSLSLCSLWWESLSCGFCCEK